MLNDVFFPGSHTAAALTTTSLLAELHSQDGCRLYFAQAKLLDQSHLCFICSLAGTNSLHYLIDVVKSNLETFQKVGALSSLTQLVLSTTTNHNLTVLYVFKDN